MEQVGADTSQVHIHRETLTTPTRSGAISVRKLMMTACFSEASVFVRSYSSTAFTRAFCASCVKVKHSQYSRLGMVRPSLLEGPRFTSQSIQFGSLCANNFSCFAMASLQQSKQTMVSSEQEEWVELFTGKPLASQIDKLARRSERVIVNECHSIR
jgi:hypothetical protein